MENKWGPRGRAAPSVNRTHLRRSKSTSELTTTSKKPLAERNGVGQIRIHPSLPKPETLRQAAKIGNMTSTSAIRNTANFKRSATVPLSTSAKRPCPDPGSNPKASVAAKKIPPYDFKARFNDLLEKHKPMKAEYLELKRSRDELDEELVELRSQREEYQLKFEELQRAVDTRTVQVSELSRVNALLDSRCDQLKDRCDSVQEENWRLQEKLSNVEAELHDVSERFGLAEQINRQQEELISKQSTDIEELQESTQRLHWERRSLHNKLQDLKGNIRVVFRVRPALAVGRSVATMSFPDVCTIELERLEPGANRRLTKHDFKFDRVFGPASSQEDVWEEVSCLIQSALDGYNVCIFAYGQTGSGKTYTMEGTGDDPGVIPRCCTMLFESVTQLSKSGWKYTVHASFLEIYNEQLFDLLEPEKKKDLEIRMADSKGTDVYVTNLSEREVRCAIDLLKLAARAQQNRQTAATAGNDRSSRSHSVTRVRLIAKHAARELTLTSCVCLVDLAGSESAKNTQRLKETKNINRSLSELGQVILALQQKQEHIPFRNSKLTRLLEPQLGGAAKALLVAAAAPYEDCSHESLSTLRFATQVGTCSTAAARRNLALSQPTAAQAKDS